MDTINFMLKRIGIPEDLYGARMTDLDADTRSRMATAAEAGHGAFLCGPVGCGKSHAVVARLVDEYERQCAQPHGYAGKLDMCEARAKPFRFETEKGLFLRIRTSFDRQRRSADGESDIDIIDEYCNYDWLVIDDLGVSKPTEFVVDTLDHIIDWRYSKRKSKRTDITSNLSLDELAQKLDDRITSRIAGMCDVIKLVGSDRRMGK